MRRASGMMPTSPRLSGLDVRAKISSRICAGRGPLGHQGTDLVHVFSKFPVSPTGWLALCEPGYPARGRSLAAHGSATFRLFGSLRYAVPLSDWMAPLRSVSSGHFATPSRSPTGWLALCEPGYPARGRSLAAHGSATFSLIVVALAFVATVVSSLFAQAMLVRFTQGHRPEHRAWAVALGMFALASAALATGASTGWDRGTFRVFYLFGAIVNVPWLAAGTVFLLASERVARRVQWGLVLFTGFAAGVVL